MSKITYKCIIREITYENKIYITGMVSIKNNKDIHIPMHVYNKPINDTWVFDMLDTTDIISKNDFFSMCVVYDSKDGLDTKDPFDICNIIFTVDKNILIMGQLPTP